ncbi:MAG TPA: thiamine pyrophosphate-dependent enzyme [Mycobacteriales bacterium]|nr:thiamine pyrophosphate-dependent enzyme [Mycobacteriales bacterium]
MLTGVGESQTVRSAVFDVCRHYGLTTWFGNPGSTEIPLLADLPDDIRYVLGLHENAVVAAAAGFAIGTESAALVSLHTTAGLGNAVSAIATARVNRAPLVVLVGQQDRRHLLAEPFLTGRLGSLAGDYVLDVLNPPRPQDVPTCIAQARHTAIAGRGPVVVIVPMGDWDEPMDATVCTAPSYVASSSGVSAGDVERAVEVLSDARAPALITGAGADSADTWAALVSLADRLDCPVFHEPFTSRAGFPQDSPRFAGFLPAGRAALRERLAPYDVVLVVGAAMLRQYHFESGPLVAEGTRVVVVSDDPAEVRRSPADVGVIAPPASAVAAIDAGLSAGSATPGRPSPTGIADRLRLRLRADGSALTPELLFGQLATRVAAGTVIVEESPSSRDALQLLVPTREPGGFLSAAMGGLGFGVPAAIGLRMARPDRPVLAVIGDGSSIYCIQALWTAVRYDVGVVFFVMENGHYLVMERLTERRGKAPWPSLSGVSVAGLARGFGVPTVEVRTPEEVTALLDDVIPGLADRNEPLLVSVALAASS